jgi:hypothetical protein
MPESENGIEINIIIILEKLLTVVEDLLKKNKRNNSYINLRNEHRCRRRK